MSKDYYPKVFLEEYKYIDKEIKNQIYITEETKVSSDYGNSDPDFDSE